MKNFFSISIVLLALSGNIYSQSKFGSESDSELSADDQSNKFLISAPEQKTLNTFNIYTSSGIVIISCVPGIESECTLCVKNKSGELVYTDPMKEISGSFIKELDLSSQPKGVYFIEINHGDSKTVEKIVFQ